MKITVVEYNSGNVQSVLFALKRLGVSAEVTKDPKKISTSDKVIFPGVGEAGSTMRFLRSKGLDKIIPAIKQPLLGICLGLQLLFKSSEENSTECLGVFDGQVKKFTSEKGRRFKIPHIGWNNIYNLKSDLFKDIPENSQVYFVHSYFAPLSAQTTAVCSYASDFSAAITLENFYALQFHPEKSGETGEQILKNFLQL
jgi:glutamine amidotransferase